MTTENPPAELHADRLEPGDVARRRGDTEWRCSGPGQGCEHYACWGGASTATCPAVPTMRAAPGQRRGTAVAR